MLVSLNFINRVEKIYKRKQKTKLNDKRIDIQNVLIRVIYRDKKNLARYSIYREYTAHAKIYSF